MQGGNAKECKVKTKAIFSKSMPMEKGIFSMVV
jgi:hypothetical protein